MSRHTGIGIDGESRDKITTMNDHKKSSIFPVWGRRLLYLVVGMLAAGALLVAAVLAFFDD
jgi:hypothetical protein